MPNLEMEEYRLFVMRIEKVLKEILAELRRVPPARGMTQEQNTIATFQRDQNRQG